MLAQMGGCAHCGGHLPPPAATGRPRRFCSATCRQGAYERRLVRRSPRHEWWTPPRLRALVQDIVKPALDGAACPDSTLAAEWLGPRHSDPSRRDALAFQHWADLSPRRGWVWLNPPYNPVAVMRRFLESARTTAQRGTPVLALVPASVGTRWWREAVEATAQAYWVLDGRVTYTGPHSVGYPAPWPSALVVYSPRGTKRMARDVMAQFREGWAHG